MMNKKKNPLLALKTPITSATEDNFRDIFPNFQKRRYDIS